ncbi:tRNA dimethylallyltransferase 2 [Sesamum angolense]|uniref:tRNA dimethylallyltransferase 2 n=1 Tax=Sesamum angolense TaxID=2727404 RepID=A0AAE1VZM6_9LAMI|nr:tRNA dimethylallyltransferase 2 [Sesamum angolense]
METESTPELQLAGANQNPDPNSKPKIVVIMGATGSGKSKLAIDLASHFSIEIINADSMQLIDEIWSRNCLPVIVGGTNYYIQALVSRFLLDDHVEDPEANCLFDLPVDSEKPSFELGPQSENCCCTYSQLKDIDPVAANRIHPNDQRKIKQYLSLYARLGILPSKLFQGNTMQNWGRADNLRYDCCFICLDASLPAIDQYVNQRVDLMVSAGLLEEVRDIYKLNADYTRGLRQAIGVREFEDFLKYWNSECLQSSACPELFNENICQIMDSTGDSDNIWAVEVAEPSVNIIKSFLNETASSEATKRGCEDTKLAQRDLWTRYVCQACGNKELRGAHEWEQHQRGRSHRKRVSHLRKSGHLVRFDPEK